MTRVLVVGAAVYYALDDGVPYTAMAGCFGARNIFLGMGWAACASAFVFAFGAQDFLSALLLYGFAGLCADGFLLAAAGTLLGQALAMRVLRQAPNVVVPAESRGPAISLASLRFLWLHKPARYNIIGHDREGVEDFRGFGGVSTGRWRYDGGPSRISTLPTTEPP